MRGWECGLVVWAAVVAGCSSPAFVCQSDDQCRRGAVLGQCTNDGVCAFPNDTCESGFEYGALASGSLAGMCVPPPIPGGSSTTDPTTAGTSSSTTTTGSSSTSSTGPVDPTTDGTTATTDPPTGGGSTGSKVVEVCNGTDDDGDGIIDEVSENNTDCGGCRLEQRNDQAIWICTTEVAWTDALDACRAVGADLLSIHDAETDAYALLQLQGLDQRAWIGLNDLDAEGTFVWSDGTPVDYDNWATNQPDDIGGEDCTHPRSSSGLWNDEICSVTMPYLCAAAHSL